MDYLNYPNLLMLSHCRYELSVRGLDTAGDVDTLRGRLREAVQNAISPSPEIIRTLDVESELVVVAQEVKLVQMCEREYEPDPALRRDKPIVVRYQHCIARLNNLLGITNSEQTDVVRVEINRVTKLLENFERRVRDDVVNTTASLLDASSLSYATSSFTPTVSFPSAFTSAPPVSAISSIWAPTSNNALSLPFSQTSNVSQVISRPGMSTFAMMPPRFSPFGFAHPSVSRNDPFGPSHSSFVPVSSRNAYSQENFSRAFSNLGEITGGTQYPAVNPSTDFASFLGNERPVFSTQAPNVHVSSDPTPYCDVRPFAGEHRSYSGETSWLRNSKVYSKIPNPMTRLLQGLPEANGLDPEKLIDFLKKVLRIRDKIGSVDVDILEGILPITSPPLSYCVTQGLNSGGDFNVFHQAALSLLPALMGRRLKYTLVDRFQAEDESFADFVQDISLMARVVRDPRSESELVDIVISNMHPGTGMYFTFQEHPRTFVDLLRLAQIAQDRMFAESQRKNLSTPLRQSFLARPNLAQPPNKRVVNHVPEPIETEPISEVNHVSPNISKPNNFSSSPNNRPPGPRHCFTCGIKGHISRDCPKRVDPKN